MADWWSSDERLQGPCGWFREVATPRAERFETLFSSPDRREGVAHLAASMSGEIREHAYWAQTQLSTDKLIESTALSVHGVGLGVQVHRNTHGAILRKDDADQWPLFISNPSLVKLIQNG